MTRLLIIGRNSLIARHIADWRKARGLETHAVCHNEVRNDDIAQADVVLTAAIHPDFWSADYDPEIDFESRMAELVAQTNAHLIMLSTRKVYGTAEKWAAREDGLACGEGAYGRNKRRAERSIERCMGDQATILRLSNIAAFEYPEPGRRTFMAMVLRSLKESGTIRYDMARHLRRDFLPMPDFLALLDAFIEARPAGVFNAGSGIALPVGKLADWVREGFGAGELVIEDRGGDDEFYLDMTKTHSLFGNVIDEGKLKAYFIELGRYLRDAE